MSNKTIKIEPLVGKVSGILNVRELTINIGMNKNVILGMKFKILSEEPVMVKDPDTGEELGLIDREKIRVEVTEVQEKFSICKTYSEASKEDVYIKPTAWEALISGMTMYEALFPRRRSYPTAKTLKKTDSPQPEPLSEKESYVRIGDRANQIIE